MMGFIVLRLILLREVFEPVKVLLFSFLFWNSVEGVAYRFQSHESLKKRYKLLSVCVYTFVYITITDVFECDLDQFLHRKT